MARDPDRFRVLNERLTPVRAFTLIEVLVALTLTAVVLSVAAQVAIQSLQGEKRVAQSIAELDRVAFFSDALKDDLGLLVDGVPGRPCLSLTAGVPQRLELTTLALVQDAPDAWSAVRRPSKVSYQLERQGVEQPRFELVRQSLDLTRADAVPWREVVAEGLVEWNLELFQDGKGLRSFPVLGKPGLPRLLRASVRWSDGQDAGTLAMPVRIDGV